MITALLSRQKDSDRPREITFDPLSVESFTPIGDALCIRTRSGNDFKIHDPRGIHAGAIRGAKEAEARAFLGVFAEEARLAAELAMERER